MIAAVIGGGSLAELRHALITAEAETMGGAGPRVAPMLDPAQAPALLRRAGFADPVVEVERVTLLYRHLRALMTDLRAMGETNVLGGGARRPLRRATIARAEAVYAEAFAGPDGRLPASFEVLTLTGWAEGGAAASEPVAQPGDQRSISRRHGIVRQPVRLGPRQGLVLAGARHPLPPAAQV